MVNHIENDSSESVTSRNIDKEAKITVAIGGFEVEVRGNDLDEAEESFFRVWEQALADAEEMSDALTGRLSEYH
jgi:hypothetical protein